MAKAWKEPKTKAWYSFFVDGKRIATIEDSAACKKETARVRGLVGIVVRHATSEELIAVSAQTNLPARIVNKMQDLARAANYAKRGR